MLAVVPLPNIPNSNLFSLSRHSYPVFYQISIIFRIPSKFVQSQSSEMKPSNINTLLIADSPTSILPRYSTGSASLLGLDYILLQSRIQNGDLFLWNILSEYIIDDISKRVPFAVPLYILKRYSQVGAVHGVETVLVRNLPSMTVPSALNRKILACETSCYYEVKNVVNKAENHVNKSTGRGTATPNVPQKLQTWNNALQY